ncbi:MAG: ATP-dependent zinc metalloprotease FtsH [Dehalococcoidia bacterium]|nr:ATP-dependent zinc metalloprotease FtsH [Dehalococcoidia bacterium]
MDPKWLRNSFVYLLILVAVVAIFFVVFKPEAGTRQDISLSLVTQMAKNREFTKLEVKGDLLSGYRGTERVFISRKEAGASIYEVLQRAGVDTANPGFEIEVKPPSQFGGVFGLLINFLPLIFFGALLLFMMRQAQGTNSQAMSFGKSRARMFNANRPTVTFADVAGVEEAKQELAEVVDFLKYPERFVALGARIPRGVLLIGPPGTGKTLLARAVAGEAGVPFFSISGSEFVEMFVGVGASRVRDLFEQAKRNAPCIVFIDEIDAVGRQRGAGLGGSHDEREQTLNQILVEMDGFDTNTNVIIVAATNRPDILDPALLRPGRFDRQVVVDKPDLNGRKAILQVHAKGKPLDKDAELDVLAKVTPGFSGADLANLLNEAAILAARRSKKVISMAELHEAVDRVIAGPERKSRVITPKEKEITAYHEAGHALVASRLPNADPVQKISIVSRGMMGGYTRLLPEEDRYIWTRSQFKDMLAYSLGGRAAEFIVFGEITTGAENDIEQATRIARKMVTEYGMSEKLGPRAFGRKQELVFLGREIGEQRNYSEKVAEEIDAEVQEFINTAYVHAQQVLLANRLKLDQIARRLIEVETVDGAELQALLSATAPAEAPERERETPAPEPIPVAAEQLTDEEPDKVKRREKAPQARPQPAAGESPAPA